MVGRFRLGTDGTAVGAAPGLCKKPLSDTSLHHKGLHSWEIWLLMVQGSSSLEAFLRAAG